MIEEPVHNVRRGSLSDFRCQRIARAGARSNLDDRSSFSVAEARDPDRKYLQHLQDSVDSLHEQHRLTDGSDFRLLLDTLLARYRQRPVADLRAKSTDGLGNSALITDERDGMANGLRLPVRR
jgi:hypothetical protein